ncbi:MAG: 4-(cytidine 5'-diphospho)-2-C-methyl-D-erythritol kinase [Proteobacteria bacterium]|nr:4-(cytidine 5'-diphospho)-2-C-methyl-D-erythritol kinase [Pseudomonadota bacterium]
MLIANSFAKINLYLEIVGRNAQGYHLLDSLMASIALHDVIKIEENAADLSLQITGEYADELQGELTDNIIIKAVNLLAKNYAISTKLKISLTKNIPTGAGLGGGSSNAATMLKLLNKLYKLNLSQAQLMDLALQLGCDVPFCLQQKMAVVGGVGEKIGDVRIKQEDWFLLIVNPRKSLSTKRVFELFNEKYRQENHYQAQEINSDQLIDLIAQRQNHLQKPAIELVPQINDILSALSQQQGCAIARMSGSGATCFALFTKEEQLKKSQEALKTQFPNFFITNSKILL